LPSFLPPLATKTGEGSEAAAAADSGGLGRWRRPILAARGDGGGREEGGKEEEEVVA
jgi:hypothetical protein